MKEVARLEHRRVERFAVEADQRAGTRELVGDGTKHRPLVGVLRQQELPRDERRVGLERSTADEKHLRPGAAAQTRCLEIEEHKRRTRRRPAGIERRLARCRVQTLRKRANRLVSVARGRRETLLDDVGIRAPFAAKYRQRVVTARGCAGWELGIGDWGDW